MLSQCYLKVVSKLSKCRKGWQWPSRNEETGGEGVTLREEGGRTSALLGTEGYMYKISCVVQYLEHEITTLIPSKAWCRGR